MKELSKALIIVLLSQLFYWGLFTLIMENTIIAQSVSEDIVFILIPLLEDNILQPCHQAKCFLNSIIYIINGQLMIILAIIIGIIQFIITMINKLKTNK